MGLDKYRHSYLKLPWSSRQWLGARNTLPEVCLSGSITLSVKTQGNHIGEVHCMSNTYDQIKEAVLKKLQVIAMYKGKYREMCPHVIGTKNGREKVLFYQFAGQPMAGYVCRRHPTSRIKTR